MKGSMALKVAQQFATLRLVAYKPVTYKKISVAQASVTGILFLFSIIFLLNLDLLEIDVEFYMVSP